MALCNDPCDDVGIEVSDWIKRNSNEQETNKARLDSTKRNSNNRLASYWGSLWTINENLPSLKKREEESS
jgi:hypothetical protein